MLCDVMLKSNIIRKEKRILETITTKIIDCQTIEKVWIQQQQQLQWKSDEKWWKIFLKKWEIIERKNFPIKKLATQNHR